MRSALDVLIAEGTLENITVYICNTDGIPPKMADANLRA
jgi:hypothetical protein